MRPRNSRTPSVTGIARHGRLKRFSPVGGIFGLIGIAIAVLAVSSLALAGVAVFTTASKLAAPVSIGKTVAPPPAIGAYPGGFNILLVGDDTRAGQGGIGAGPGDGGALNDVTILLHVSADHQFATAVSFPRDMIIPHAQCSKGGTSAGLPVNTALSYGGLPCVVTQIQSFTGVPIQFAGLITFDGSDLGRISSQQVYLSALVRKMETAGTLSNPLTVYNIANAATANMQLSTSLQSIPTMISIASTLKNIEPSNVVFVQYPGSTGGTGIFTGKVQPTLSLGDQLMTLIKDDKPFTLGTQGDNRGSVVTGTTSTAAPIAGSTVVNGLIGQSAAQETCSKTRPLIDQ